MKNIMKSTLAILLAILMIGGAAPIGALSEIDWSTIPDNIVISCWDNCIQAIKTGFARFGKWQNGLSFFVNAATYKGTYGWYNEFTWDLDTDTGLLVLSGQGVAHFDDGEAPWYPYRRFIKKAIISDGITYVGHSSFYGCDCLADVVFSNSVYSIGFNAFKGCSSLTRIMLPNSIQYINDEAFADCTNLKTINIPYGIQEIDQGVFSGCTSLTEIAIPESVKYIRTKAFSGCKSIVSILIPDSVIAINDYAFANCVKLDDVFVPDSVSSLGEGVFSGCVKLSDIRLSDYLEYIEDSLFSDCTGLICIAIPKSIISISRDSFSGCTKLKNIELPTSLRRVYAYAFFKDIPIENVYYKGSQAQWETITIDSNNDCLTNAFIHFDSVMPNDAHLNDEADLFAESTYIADIWLNQGRAETTIESQLVSEMMDYYSPSSDMYLSLKSDTAFQAAVAGWNGFKTISDPAGSGKKLSNVSDIYETLILDMLERATNNDAENYNNAFVNALDLAGESADVITDFKDAVDHFDDALAKGSITLDTIRNWKVNPGDDTWVKFAESFKAAGENNKTPWGESKFVEGIGTLAEGISDVSDFYKRLCAYMYACNMKTDMVEFLTEMGKQSIPSHFRTALNNVLNAVNDTNYASLICTLELGEDLAFDVLKGVWKDLTKLFPIYGFFKTVIDGAMAVDNMLFNTQSIVDKYFLLEATYNYFSATKSVIGNTKNRYLSNRTEKNAAAYVFAMRNFQYAYEIDLESAVAFTKAADDEGVVNGVKNGARLLSNLITGANEKTNYQKMSDSADSIKGSLASLFHTLDTSWKFNVGYLKTDYPDVYPIYVQKELSKAEYTPVITYKYLSQKGSSNIEWFIPYGYTDKDGNYHHMSSYIVDGVDVTETASGSTTSRSSALDDGNGYVVEFVNNSTFTSFPKTYSIKGYSNTGSGKVYTGTKTESFEKPLKKPIVGIPSDSQMIANISSGYTAIGIYDTTQNRYENIKYKVYRRTDSSSWKLLDTIDKTDSFLLHRTIYKDTTATIKQNYYYKVSSYIDFSNGKRLESPESDVVCMRVSDVVNNAMNLVLTPIQTIVHAKAPKKAISKTQTNTATNDSAGIQLSWNSVTGVNGYEIYRLASYGTTYKLIDTVAASVTSYVDENISDGITYTYVVIPYSIDGSNKEYTPQNNGNKSIAYSEPTSSNLLRLDSKQELQGETGQVVNMDLRITSNPGIAALNLTVTYDDELIELVGASDSGLLRGFNSPDNYGGGRYVLNWEDGLASTNNQDTGTIAVLSFRLKKNFSVTSITISGTGYNVDVQSVSVDGCSCQVTNTSYQGDSEDKLLSIKWGYAIGTSNKTRFRYYESGNLLAKHYYESVNDYKYAIEPASLQGKCKISVLSSDPRVIQIHEATKRIIPVGNGEATLTIIATAPDGTQRTDRIIGVVNDSPYTPITTLSIGYNEVQSSSSASYNSSSNTVSLFYKESFQFVGKMNSGASLNQKDIYVELGNGNKIQTVAATKYRWESSNEKVATVDQAGQITTKGKGTTTITLTIKDNGKEISKSVNVQVRFYWWQILIRIFLLGFIWY